MKRNGKGVWIREIEKALKRFDASLEWLEERISLRDEEIEVMQMKNDLGEREKSVAVRAKKAKSIEDVLEEVVVLIDTHFTEFSGTKSSAFLKKVIMYQSVIDMILFKKTWRSLNCSPKTMKVVREIQENLLCVGKRKELITKKKRTETLCWCSKTRLPLNAKHIISCCKRVFVKSSPAMTLW